MAEAVVTAPVTTIAVPFSPLPPEKYLQIVEACVAHRPWFHDFLWNSGPEYVRTTVNAHLADAFNNGRIWEIWRGGDLTGIALVNELVPFIDCRAHFVFFDSKLADKYQLCVNLMEWCYEHLPVETIRIEVPTYARALLKFIRKLGYRFESEQRPFSWPQNAAPLSADVARLGSRKHHGTLYEGQWHDVLLLSQTKDEFLALKEQHRGTQD